MAGITRYMNGFWWHSYANSRNPLDLSLDSTYVSQWVLLLAFARPPVLPRYSRCLGKPSVTDCPVGKLPKLCLKPSRFLTTIERVASIT